MQSIIGEFMRACLMRRSSLLLPVLLSAAMSMLGACGKKQAASETAAAAPAVAAAAVPDPHDPCRLLQTSEAETLLGAPLAGAPFRAGPPNHSDAGVPQADGPACWYETADFRNVAVQVIWRNAGAVISGVGGYLAKAEKASGGLVKLQDGSELTGEWDEVRVLGCCDFVALLGDSAVEIDFGGSAATAEQAAVLADAALRRITALLPIDGTAGIAAAEQRQALRPKAADACSILDAADFEATVGMLKGAPQASSDECTYIYEADNGRQQLFVSTVHWRNGYRRYREDKQMLAGIAGSLAREIGSGGESLTRNQAIEGPWDAAQSTPIQFSSVRHDVAIYLRHGGLSADDIRALLGRAYQKFDSTNSGKGSVQP
jgi:hypothetical protein